MSNLFGNHIAGFPTRWLKWTGKLNDLITEILVACPSHVVINDDIIDNWIDISVNLEPVFAHFGSVGRIGD